MLSRFSRVRLCDTMEWMPGSSVRVILQARILGSAPCPPPGDHPFPGTEFVSLTSQVGSYHKRHLASPMVSTPYNWRVRREVGWMVNTVLGSNLLPWYWVHTSLLWNHRFFVGRDTAEWLPAQCRHKEGPQQPAMEKTNKYSSWFSGDLKSVTLRSHSNWKDKQPQNRFLHIK